MPLGSLTFVVLLGAGSLAFSASGNCADVGTWTSTCSVENSGSQVDIAASEDRPGSPSRSDSGNHSASGSSRAEEAPAADQCDSPMCRPLYSVVSLPDVTIDDLASFRPATPSLAGEPDGFGVVGMPANIVAAASEQLIPGNLLGWDVLVRFRPAGYVFTYGDGSTRRTATGGSSWARLGQAQFSPTATSHVYRMRGTYPVSVTVQYSAAVDFGTGWRPVPGYVSATSSGYDVRVVEVKTALVDRTCLENPAGPGC